MRCNDSEDTKPGLFSVVFGIFFFFLRMLSGSDLLTPAVLYVDRTVGGVLVGKYKKVLQLI